MTQEIATTTTTVQFEAIGDGQSGKETARALADQMQRAVIGSRKVQEAPAEDLSEAEKRRRMWAALARARLEIEPVEKDGQTSGNQKYRFASAQAILESGRPAMAKHGLCLFPIIRKFVESEMMLHTEYLLTHEDGAELTIYNMTPVVITEFNSGARTARDKALGAARTVDLRYTYRDTLGIPQVDPEEEEHSRNDNDGRERFERARGGHSAERDPRKQPNNPPNNPPPTQPKNEEKPQTKSEETAKPAQTEQQRNDDIEARKRTLKETITTCRAELGAELAAQLGLDGNPPNMKEAEALAKKLQEAVEKKRARAASNPPPADQTKPAEQPKDESIDWT